MRKTTDSRIRIFTVLTALIAAGVTAQAVFTMSDAEVEAGFKKYEDRINALEREVRTLRHGETLPPPIYVVTLPPKNVLHSWC